MNLHTRTQIACTSLEGEILSDAVLDAREMAYMNFARAEFSALENLILGEIIPAFPAEGGDEHPLVVDLRRHIEQVITFSGNFCWRHRYLGQMHDAVNVGGAV